jgi:hypothetical protein
MTMLRREEDIVTRVGRARIEEKTVKLFKIAEPAQSFITSFQSAILWPVNNLSSAGLMPEFVLSENSQQIAHQQNDQHCTKPYACASARSPAAIAKVSSSASENEH